MSRIKLLFGILIGKSSWSPSGRRSRNTSGVLSVFDNSSLSIRSGRNNNNIFRVFDGHNDSGSKLNFLIDFFDIDDMDTLTNIKIIMKNVIPLYI
jgi:hypothetical protein